jgi:hydrogenase-4 component F
MTGMTNVAVLVLLLTPLLAGLLSLMLRHARLLHGLNLATMTALLVAETHLAGQVLDRGPVKALGELVYVDALSAFVLFILVAVGLSCSLYTWAYLDDYVARGAIAGPRLSRFFFLFHVFLFAMVVATVANSLGLLWVAIEGTTLATTFLIAFFRRREGLEAGWKYLILCSVGIALALFGTVLTYYSSVRVLGDVSSALNITKLVEVADRLDPHVLKLAFIFILVGYGTKIGLVPMHAWLPEAYSEAPAPVTAMLAGVLETVAVYAVLRCKIIVDHALPPWFTGNLLILLGLISFIVAALFMLVQRDYKRLFAYSSIEHMGLAAMGFGVGGIAGVFGGLFHLLNHALAKSLAFFAAGNVSRRFETREIQRVRGLARVQPFTAMMLLVAGFALVGMPPFALFNSEVLLVSALATQSFASDTLHVGQFVTITIDDTVRSVAMVTLFLVFAVVVFGGFTYRLVGMVWGAPPDQIVRGERWDIGHVPLVVTALALAGLGMTMPDQMRAMLDQATRVVLGK